MSYTFADALFKNNYPKLVNCKLSIVSFICIINQMSIFDKIKDYTDKNPLRFHTPGHNGILNPYDVTELADESFPADSIIKAQTRVAEFYGAKYCRFLVNGSSIGIKAAILALNGDILTTSHCHQSIAEGCNLAKVELFKCDTGFDNKGLPNLPTIDDIKSAFKNHPTIKAVYLESPDYYGRVLDSQIIDYIKQSGKLFFCDAAHGAHFNASGKLKNLSYSNKADVINLSAHKTLNAYTQAAFLCVNNQNLISEIDMALKNLGTTSPSYLLLSSLESCIVTAINFKDEYNRLHDDIKELKQEFVCLQNDDFTRVVVDASQFNLTGKDLSAKLIKQNIYAERHCGDYLVFIFTINHTTQEIEFLRSTLEEL